MMWGFALKADSDLNEVGTEGLHAESGGTVYVVGRDRTLA